jgi:hypothetical protein
MRRRREKYLVHNTISLNPHHFFLYTIVRLLKTALVNPHHELKNIIPSSERLVSIQANSFLQEWIPCVIIFSNSQQPAPPAHLVRPSEYASTGEPGDPSPLSSYFTRGMEPRTTRENLGVLIFPVGPLDISNTEISGKLDKYRAGMISRD